MSAQVGGIICWRNSLTQCALLQALGHLVIVVASLGMQGKVVASLLQLQMTQLDEQPQCNSLTFKTLAL